MAIQYSTTTRNRLRDAYAAAFPAGTVIQFRTGTKAGVTNAAGGTLVAEITLPATPFTLTDGTLARNGTWSVAAVADGIIAHYRAVNGSDIEEGTVSEVGGGGDIELDNTDVNEGQVVSVVTWGVSAPGA
jgi:hypothetical protein